MRFRRRTTPAPEPTTGPLAALLTQVPAEVLHPERVQTPEELGDPSDWRFELKYDGWRMLAYVIGRDVILRSRKGVNWTLDFPWVVEGLQNLELPACVLDGEVCALDAENIPDFNLLQQRDDNARWVYFAFDVLFHLKADMRKEPLEVRQKALRRLVKPGSSATVFVSPSVEGDPKSLFHNACAAGHEGLVAKKKGSLYTQGESDDWVKVKYAISEDFVIVGYIPYAATTAAGSLLLAAWDGERFRYAGRVGSGLKDKDRTKLARELNKHRTNVPQAEGVSEDAAKKKGVIWSKPQLVVEVTYRERTESGEFRESVYKRLRDAKDKTPKDCIWKRPKESG